MANFLVIIDPDEQRRSRFIQTIEPLLPPIPDLITDSCSWGDVHACWAAASTAPMSYVADEAGMSILWGEALERDTPARLDASRLRELWASSTHPPCFDGFYCGVVYHPTSGLKVGADLIGSFPVYYYCEQDVVMVASSPELFKYHPLFKKAFNPAGLVGILLTNGVFNGQTLFKNVRRLEAGYLFIWTAQLGGKEILQYYIPAHYAVEPEWLASLPFAEQIDTFAKSIDQAIARLAPRELPHSFLLSGGLDSRILAGFIHRQGIPTQALTLGRGSDFDVEGAAAVARTLGFEHHTGKIRFADYPAYAESLVKWEHLSNGCNRFMFQGFNPHLKRLAPRFIAGFSIEVMMGGKGASCMPVHHTCDMDTMFDMFWQKGINNWGLSPEILEKLFRKDVFGSLVQDTVEEIKQAYYSYSDNDFKRNLFFDLYHRQRFHIGSGAWQLCFSAWPILPNLERHFLEMANAMPVDTIAYRRAQKAMVCRLFPALARIPLVDNSAFVATPLLKEQQNSVMNQLRKAQWKWRRLQNKLGIERRYFCRIYDINRPGWHAVRQQAEPYRERVGELFNQEVFNELLPPPDSPVSCTWDPAKSSGIKALVGFLLWSKHNL
jgi:asparagine synthase (glutamine-hydrolysing)